MQTCKIRGCTVKRDMDLFRELLLKIEANPQMDGTREFYFNSPEDMGISGHSVEEVAYHLKLLIEAGFVDGAVTVLLPMHVIRTLTNSGHDFLDNIRNDDIWRRVKGRVGGLAQFLALPIISGIAQAELKRHFGLS